MGLFVDLIKTNQFRCVLAVSLCSTIMGFTNSFTGTAIVSMKESEIYMDNEDISWIVSIMSLGGALGSVFGGSFIVSFGRKNTILGTALPFMCSYLFIGFADRVSMIVVGRFLGGLCVGINSMAIPIYLGETLDPAVRGLLGIFPTAFGNFGIFLSLFVGKFLEWRELAYFGTLLPIPFIALMLSVPETARYYVGSKQYLKAKTTLLWLYKDKENVTIESELRRMVEHVRRPPTEKELNENRNIFHELLSQKNMKPILVIAILMTIQQFSGINAIFGYIVPIFQSAEIDVNSNTCAIIVGFVNFFAVFLAAAVIDNLGRKVLLYISDLTMIVTLIPLGLYFYLKNNDYEVVHSLKWLPLTAALLYLLGFSFGFGPVPWLMMGEILPISIRGLSAGLLSAYNWACAFIVQRIFLILLEDIGESGTFLLFGSVCIVGFFFLIMVPETKGKTLEVIEQEMMDDVEQAGFFETMKISDL